MCVCQVLLGLGLATLVPERGNAAIEVSAPGVRVAGVLLQAGAVTSKTLISVGNGSAHSGEGRSEEEYGEAGPPNPI
eukprot:COSAG03_NODE_8719_length_776_cov_1.121123_2_plen_76_part_01